MDLKNLFMIHFEDEKGNIVATCTIFRWYAMKLQSKLNNLKLKLLGRIGRFLLRGFGEACPYCNKLVEINCENKGHLFKRGFHDVD